MVLSDCLFEPGGDGVFETSLKHSTLGQGSWLIACPTEYAEVVSSIRSRSPLFLSQFRDASR